MDIDRDYKQAKLLVLASIVIFGTLLLFGESIIDNLVKFIK
jgi:hypothetical protein